MVGCYLEALAKTGVGSVLVISHLPLVGYLVSELCPEEAPPMFATSAIAGVSFDISTERGWFTACFDWRYWPYRCRYSPYYRPTLGDRLKTPGIPQKQNEGSAQ